MQFGGQTAINLCESLQKNNIKILGTSPEATDMTENRDNFGKILDKLDMPAGFVRTSLSRMQKENNVGKAKQAGFMQLKMLFFQCVR